MQHCIIGAFLRFPPIQKMRPDTQEAPCQACCLQRRCDSDLTLRTGRGPAGSQATHVAPHYVRA